MKSSNVIFLDKIPDASFIEKFGRPQRKIYLASTREGLRSYTAAQNIDPGSLGLWVKDKKNLLALSEEAQKMNAQFFFSYQGLRPSEIVSAGSFRGPEDMELPDIRIKDISLLEPESQVLQISATARPEVSVIIPVFDNRERAQKALSFWFRQKEISYEIVLIDDGSSESWISSLVGEHTDILSLVRLSRSKKRQRGDHQFRAGLVRNIGVQSSKGSKIIFCDSDILVPEDLAARFSSQLEKFDVVMPQRWQLNEMVSLQNFSYVDISFNRDVILSPGAFWEEFQTQKKPWSEQERHWRWTSTFCLAMSRSFFEKTGGFKKTFVTYGFEDTELGFRLYKLGARFSLETLKTYHLFQPDTQSEYRNDLQRKKRLLRVSADRFFRHHPTKEVYEAMQSWLD